MIAIARPLVAVLLVCVSALAHDPALPVAELTPGDGGQLPLLSDPSFSVVVFVGGLFREPCAVD